MLKVLVFIRRTNLKETALRRSTVAVLLNICLATDFGWRILMIKCIWWDVVNKDTMKTFFLPHLFQFLRSEAHMHSDHSYYLMTWGTFWFADILSKIIKSQYTLQSSNLVTKSKIYIWWENISCEKSKSKKQKSTVIH